MKKINFFRSLLGLLIVFAFTEANAVQPPSKNKTRTYQAKSLLYMRGDETSCRIWKLELASGKNKVIYTAEDREASCPHRIDLDRKGNLLLVFKDGAQEIRLFPSVRKGPFIKYPEPKVKPKNSPAAFWYAAYSERGNIMLEMSSTYPWSDEEIYIFRYQSGNWKLIRTTSCHRTDCSYEGYDGIRKRPRNARIWGNETAAWHEKQKYNPFLAKKNTTYSETELTFKFSSKKTVLTINTERGGAHIERTITKGVFLKVGKQKMKTLALALASNQCDETELMGKYLIVYQCPDRKYDLYDLETGTSIPLHKYTWVYH